MKHLTAVLAAGLIAGAAGAQTLTYSQAAGALPPGTEGRAVLAEGSFLAEKERGIIAGLESTIPYFGALALSPTEGLYVDWLQAAGQFHSRAAARAAL